MAARGRGVGEMSQKIQTCSYKISKSWGCDLQHGDYSYQYCIVYLKVAERIDLKSSHQREKNCNYE